MRSTFERSAASERTGDDSVTSTQAPAAAQLHLLCILNPPPNDLTRQSVARIRYNSAILTEQSKEKNGVSRRQAHPRHRPALEPLDRLRYRESRAARGRRARL